jgi:hypothetical protein
MLEQKLQEELNRFNSINRYAKTMIMEQEVPPPPSAPGDVPPPPGGDVPPPPGGDVPPSPGAEPEAGADDTEEIDITDLVNMTKNIKKEIDTNKEEHGNVLTKMDDVFTKLDDLQQKLSQMDAVMAKIDQLGSEVQKMKPETPQERLEMRSLDSYPFNQRPQEFFAHKQQEMQKTGKNEYVLTKGDVEDFSKDTIKTSFNPNNEEDEYSY